MTSQIMALSPVFSYQEDADRFCAIKQGKAQLETVCRMMIAEDSPAPGLIGIYVVKDPEPDYDDTLTAHGRVIALVRPLPMPRGKTVDDYPSGCIEINKHGAKFDRWPIGWPCEVVFFSAAGGPVLEDAYNTAYPTAKRGDYAAFAHQFLQGPIDLTSKRFYASLRLRLMLEVQKQITNHPETQVRPL